MKVEVWAELENEIGMLNKYQKVINILTRLKSQLTLITEEKK